MVLGSVNFLLVEDDEIDILNFRRVLQKKKIDCALHVAHNGLEALDILRDKAKNIIHKPCIIFLDLNMPKMNGIEFLHELRSDPELQHHTILILTTSDDNRDLRAAYRYNVAGYLLKPLEMAEFEELIAITNKYWSVNKLPN